MRRPEEDLTISPHLREKYGSFLKEHGFPPDDKHIEDFFLYLYRVEAFLQSLEPSDRKDLTGDFLLLKQPKEVALALFEDDDPRFGIEGSPEVKIYSAFAAKELWEGDISPHNPETYNEFNQVIWGEVHRSLKKPFAADFIGYDLFTFRRQISGQERTFLAKVLYAADGATMLVPPNSWPDEVKRVCRTKDSQGKDIVLPDVFWRAGLAAILGMRNIPTPPEFKENSVIQSLPSRKEDIRKLLAEGFLENDAAELAEKILLEIINPSLGAFLKEAFPSFSKERCSLYPSGVMGVAVIFHQIGELSGWRYWQELSPRQMNGFCSTGDITVCIDEQGVGAWKRLTDSFKVDKHDELLDRLGGREDPLIAREIGVIRRENVGNLQGLPVETQKGFSSGEFFPNICMYTDGLDPQSGLEPSNNRDRTAIRLGLSPQLHIAEVRGKIFKGKRKADDGSFIIASSFPNKRTWKTFFNLFRF